MIETFEDVMVICREREFLQHEERLGVVLLELDQFEKARYYVSRAVSLFKGWSAPAKVYAAERLLAALGCKRERILSTSATLQREAF